MPRYYVREHFYSGDDAEAREFLMMNGTSHSADELSSDANDSDSGEEMDGVEPGPGHGTVARARAVVARASCVCACVCMGVRPCMGVCPCAVPCCLLADC